MEPERFAIIPLFPGQQPPPGCIAHGSYNCVMERIIDTHCRADAIQLLHDAAKALGTIEHSQKLADDARIRQVRAAIDALDRLSSQLDAVESAMAKR